MNSGEEVERKEKGRHSWKLGKKLLRLLQSEGGFCLRWLKNLFGLGWSLSAISLTPACSEKKEKEVR